MPVSPDTVKAVFLAALDNEPAARSTFLEGACAGNSELRQRVEALLEAYQESDPLLDHSAAWHLELRPEGQAADGNTPLPSTPLPAGSLPELTQAGRFRLEGEIARGGMGCVLRAHDPEMGRALAVKVILPQHAGVPSLVRRFLGEARLAGQLQHPGVVPVHDIGRLADGRPFFAMKLIEGRTLAALLRERPSPGHDLPRLLGIFALVCQAVAYAHSKGVIHRDLTPANIMVGPFGEVQVMDWGLAKVLADPSPGGLNPSPAEAEREEKESRQGSETPVSPTDDTLVRPLLGSMPGGGMGEDRTQAGMVLGTPAYVPPEQATGAVERLDERSDVFGLGAILCEILTGKPPYVGKDALQVRRMASNADLGDARARLEVCGADAELVGLAVACLAPTPADRPRNAQAVADELTAYLDGVQARLRTAELAQAEARARATEEAKRRRLALALASTVLLAVAVGGGVALWLQADRQARQGERTREANDALDHVTALCEKARVAPADSAALLAQAREQAQRALTLVQSGPVDEPLKLRVQRVYGELENEEKDRHFIAALDAARLEKSEPAVLYSPSGAFQIRFAEERVAPAFRTAFRAYGLAVGEGEPAAAAARLRQRPPQVRQAVRAALDEWLALAAHPEADIREPHLDWLRALAGAVPDEEGAAEFRAILQEKNLGKRRAALEKLAASAGVLELPPHILLRLAKSLLSVESLTSAVQLLRRAREQHQGDFWLNHELGSLLIKTVPGKKARGRWDFWGLEAQLPLFPGAPATPPRWADPVRYLTAAAALRPNSPAVQLTLGRALARDGQLDEARACFGRALAIDPKYVPAIINLANALADLGKVDEAIACYKKAIALDPKLAAPHCNLGAMLYDVKRDYNGAMTCFRKTIELNPRHATAHSNLGALLCDVKRDYDGAMACFRRAIKLDPRYAAPHCNLGKILCDVKRDYDGAIDCFRKAIKLDPRYAEAHGNLGVALMYKGKVDEAIVCHKKAIDLDPKLARSHLSLGVALVRQNKLDEAIDCFRKAVDVGPEFADAHCYLGYALMIRGRLTEALAPLKRGHDLGGGLIPGKKRAAEWLAECEQWAARDKEVLDVLAGKPAPANASERVEWARRCVLLRRDVAAVRLLGEAFADEAKLADDLQAGYRYQAARAAARAGTGAGDGRDDGGLTATEKLGLRKQALTWLKADLAARAKQPEDERAAMLRQWQTDQALASVRDESALRALPQAERAAWTGFWADVRKFLPGPATR
jgi:serine/threonine protein kinase/tetratricopeptide (TPR) repeat protein